jgi:hypothetical protein
MKMEDDCECWVHKDWEKVAINYMKELFLLSPKDSKKIGISKYLVTQLRFNPATF